MIIGKRVQLVQAGKPAALLAGKLIELIERHMPEMEPRQLSNSLSSIAKIRIDAKIRVDDDTVISALIREAGPKLPGRGWPTQFGHWPLWITTIRPSHLP